MSKTAEKIDIRLVLEPGDDLYDSLRSVMDNLGIKKNTEAARICIKAGCKAMEAKIAN